MNFQAVINEGLRVANPVIAGFPKKVPPGGDVVCGKKLPGGTDVHVNFQSLMRDREVFGDDVDIFRPERFIEADDETLARRRKVVDLLFGFGRWLCLGRVLALLELNKIFVEVSKLLTRAFPLNWIGMLIFLSAVERVRFPSCKPGEAMEAGISSHGLYSRLCCTCLGESNWLSCDGFIGLRRTILEVDS